MIHFQYYRHFHFSLLQYWDEHIITKSLVTVRINSKMSNYQAKEHGNERVVLRRVFDADCQHVFQEVWLSSDQTLTNIRVFFPL